MKSLKTIQVLCRIGKILSKIVFILSLVAAGIFLIALIALAFGVGSVVIDDESFGTVIENNANISMGTIYNGLIVSIVLVAGEAVIARFAELYFQHELSIGNPLTIKGARELRRLGILQIAISVGTVMVAGVIQAFFKAADPNIREMDLNNSASIVMGIMFLILSLVMQYGAEELMKKKFDEVNK